jgi:dephospho-CoA kinase
MMKWIGLTGGIGTGKSTVAQMLKALNFAVLDADQFARKVVEPSEPAFASIGNRFGSNILKNSNEIDRKQLAQIVFKDDEARLWLESILHPAIQKAVGQARAQLQSQGQLVAIYDVPLLYEKNLQSNFDAVIAVVANPDLQRSRLKARNGWSDAEIDNRLSSQLPIKIKAERADFVIINEGSQQELEKIVNQKLVPWIQQQLKHPAQFPKS